MNLSRNKTFFVFCFLTIFSSILFSSRLVFVHHVSHSPPFPFPFLFDLLFSWSPSSWTQFLYLHFLQFFNNNFTLVQKTLQFIPFTCMRYLYMSFCSYICSSVVSFSLFVFLVSNTFVSLFLVFSVHNLSERQVYGTVANLKNVCLFPFPFLLCTCFIFICLCMFVFVSKFPVFDLFSCFWTFFCFVLILEGFSLCRSLFYVPLFFVWRLCLVWSSFSHLFYFLLLPIFLFSHEAMFFELFPFVLSLFFWKKTTGCVSCLLVV